jgi:sigma-B regulation protein RsbU (phosphoserine phosphatase)
LKLGPGDFVFACTDGVTDLENPEGEMYGEERLKELLRSVARRTPAEIRRVLDASLEEFAGGSRRPDDLSYILVRRDD